MPYAISDGRPGFDGIFTVNGVALNDTSVFPHVRFTKLTGYYDAPDSDDLRAKKTGRIGESVGPVSDGGKTVVFAGVVRARTLPSLNAYRTLLQQALSDRSSEQFFTVAPPPAAGGGTQWGFNARILAPSPAIAEEQVRGPNARPSPWQREMTLTVRMSDPRFYVLDSHIDETTATPGTGVTVTNQGTAPSDPAITLSGVTADVACSVSSGGKTLEFVPAHSGNLVINFLKRTATVGAHDEGGTLDVFESTWWDANVPGLEPGLAETITATGCTGLQVQAFHASW